MNQKHIARRAFALSFIAVLAILATPGPVFGAPKAMPNPDFTKGEKIPEGAKHDWNLGATGLRGWMFCDKMDTTVARQIAITKVAKGSPADGIVAVGDVILGVGGKPFSYDPRTEMGKALTLAESEVGQGKLSLTRWRASTAAEVVVKIPVLGTYSSTAPYDCPKSKRILEQGCKALAKRMEDPSYFKQPWYLHPIPRSLNALALLASGDPAYLPLVKKEAEWAAKSSGMGSWNCAYVLLFLSEYKNATGDESVMPVHLVGEDDARNAVLVALAPDGFGLRLDALVGIEHAHGAVEHAQRTLDFDGEVDVAGGVDDVETLAFPERGGRSRRNRDAALLLLLHPVHRRGTFVHFADFVALAGVIEDAFGGRGLAGIDMRHDTEVAVVLYGMNAGHGLFLKIRCFAVTSDSARRHGWLPPSGARLHAS